MKDKRLKPCPMCGNESPDIHNAYQYEIIVISEVGSEKLDSEEILEKIISLLHCYSMKMYSSRKAKKN